MERYNEKYRNWNLSREIGQVIGTLTGFDTLIKEEQEGEIDMCTALEQLKQEYLEQGVEQGVEEERQKNIRSMYESGIEIKEIARILNQPFEYVEMICTQQS